MTVKELFQSLSFSDIIEPLTKTHPDALLPMSKYKEDYDIICNTEFSGEGGAITFCPDGDSDVYMIEGDRYFNIVGMDVVLPENSAVTKAEAAAEIIWSSAPFGRYPAIDWDNLLEEDEADYYALQVKRIDIKIALPYCRDKNIRQELIRQMQSISADLCLSAETDQWFIFGNGKLWGKRQNRSKRKRKYRLEKRHDELLRLSELHNQLDMLKSNIGNMPESLEKLVLSSSDIETAYFESKTYGKSDRIDYLKDLLLNPSYDSKRYLNAEKHQECICVLYTSPEHPCTATEQNRIIEIIGTYFNTTPWQLFIAQCNDLNVEIELDITYITQ